MIPELPTGFFALILSHHRKWGITLTPSVIKPAANKKFFEIYTHVTASSDPDSLANLSPEEYETVELLNKCSEQYLYKLFSKNKNVKEFIELVTDDLLKKRILPFIEDKIAKCLEIAKNEDIPLYIKRGTGQALHFDDKLIIPQEPAKPVFCFSRGADFSRYNLSLEYQGKRVNILNNDVEILTSLPCFLRVSNSIYQVHNIEGSKLKPFLKTDFINVPLSSEEKYYGSFVRNIINRHKVTANGFSIVKQKVKPQAILTVEHGIKGTPVAILKFKYGSHQLFYTDTLAKFIDFNPGNGNYIFTVIERDDAWESSCINIMEDTSLVAPDNINYSISPSTNDKNRDLYTLIETLSSNYSTLINNGFILQTGSLDAQYSLLPIEMDMSHALENDWFDIRATINIGDYKIPFIALRKNIISGKREYLLPDGSIAILPEEWFVRFKELFELGIENNGAIHLHKQHYAIIQNVIQENDNALLQKLESLYAPEMIPELITPSNLKAELRPYQKEGLNWLYYLQMNKLGGCLADDMGLGKTLQILALLQYNKETNRQEANNGHQKNDNQAQNEQLRLFSFSTNHPINLIIVPASLVHNWANESKRFCPDLNILIHKGSQRTKTASTFKLYDIIITTYHIARIDINLLINLKFDTIILDESQYIKNPSSLIYKAVIQLQSKHKLVLSGTPIENSLMDLWAQMNFVNPGLLGSASFFKREYSKSIERQEDDTNKEWLKKIIRPFIMRRTKEMVEKDLPSLTEHTIVCDMTDEQASIYETEKSVVRNTILQCFDKDTNKNKSIVVLQGMTRLRQVANHPILIDENYNQSSGKFKRVQEDILNITAENHKILIFSSFVKHLDIFAHWLNRKNIGFSYLTGSSCNREEIISEFQHNQLKQVFLISIKAGGVGLNLTGADYVMILDPWWNPAVEDQAIGRAHRIGQEKAVFVYRYISEDTIEEKIAKLQERKSNLSEEFVALNNPFAEMSKDTLLTFID